MEKKKVDSESFDANRMDEYAARAKASWGKTSQWAEYEQKSAGRTREEEQKMGDELLALFVPFGQMASRGEDPASEAAAEQAKRIQDYITEHFYQCSDEVFLQLGRTYGAGGEFTQNINSAAGRVPRSLPRA